MYIETFPEKLKQARISTGFSQQEVSKEVHISNVTLSNYERGITQPDIDSLKCLAEFYMVSCDWLIGTKGRNRKR